MHNDSERLLANGIIPDGFKKYAHDLYDSDGEPYTEQLLVEIQNKYGLNGEHIKNASPSRNPLTQEPMILFTFNSDGGAAMYQLSSKNIGERMAIILDDKLISAPTLQSAIQSNGQISGNFTMEEAAVIAVALVNPLNVPLMIKERYADSELSLGAALLRIAAIRNYPEIIELLIKQRPEVINAMGKNKETALDFATRRHTETADLLRKHGGKTAKELQPPSQLLPIPDNLVVLTFDDGNKSDFANVPKVLKKHGFGATFYVTEGLGFLKNPQNYLSWEQIRQLHEMGYEIGNHTQHHRNVSHLKSEELAASLAHIDKRCAENKITKPVTFCYPGFHNNHASVKVLEKHGFLFARRGVGPEYKDPGKGARGPAYDPKVDDPLLVPTTGYAGPDWKMKDLKWAIDQAEDGKITVLCFHGIPAIEHPWVSTDLKDFEKYMQYLKDEGCTVIAMRDLAKYVNPNHRPHKADPYQPVRKRVAEMKRKAAKKE